MPRTKKKISARARSLKAAIARMKRREKLKKGWKPKKRDPRETRRNGRR